MDKRTALNLCRMAEKQGVDVDIIDVDCGAYSDHMLRVWDVDCVDQEANAVLRFPEAIYFEEFLEANGYEFERTYVPWEHEFLNKESFKRFCGWPLE